MPVSVLLANRAALPAVGGDVVPSVTANPTLASDGTPQVGESITQGAGTATGTPTPTPTMTLEVSANGSSGWSTQTATSNWQAADETKYFRTKVVWNNSAGSATAYSSVVGPIAESSDPGVLSVPFQLTAASTKANAPWVFGHVFAEGEVPSGQTIVASGETLQASIRNTWPDGSAKFAQLAGRRNLSTTPATLTLTAGSAPGGSNVALSALQALITDNHNTVDLGTYGVCDLHDAVSATSTYTSGNTGNAKWSNGLVRQITAGPVMSEWLFYTRAPSDTHLAVFWYCQLWSTGELRIRAVVENGWLNVSGPIIKSFTVTIKVNNTSRYTGSIGQLHHTRFGMPFWFDATMPEVLPKHSISYIRACKVLPPYGFFEPSEDAFDGLASTTLTPFDQGDWPNAMGQTGAQDSIGLLPNWEALYCTSTDARAFRSTIANAYKGGRYPIHYRDETTLKPIAFTSYPNLVLRNSNNIGVGQIGTSSTGAQTPALGDAQGAMTNSAGYAIGVSTVTLASTGTGAFVPGHRIVFNDGVDGWSFRFYTITSGDSDISNGGSITFTPALSVAIPASSREIEIAIPTWDVPHSPSLGFLAYVLTGDTEHLETLQFSAGISYLRATDTAFFSPGQTGRWEEEGVMTVENCTVRGTGWAWRTLAQALCITPDDDPLQDEYAASWAHNMARFKERYIDGTDGYSWGNNFGLIGRYGDYTTGATQYSEAPWMHAFATQALAYAKDMGLNQSSQSLSDHNALLTHMFKHAVGFLGDGSGTSYNYRRGAQYYAPYYKNKTLPPVFQDDWNDIFDDLQTIRGWSGLGAGTSLRQPDADTDAQPDQMRSGWWGNMLPAFSYAKEFGATGADSAFARLIGASNWSDLAAECSDHPVFGILPRNYTFGAPSWLASAQLNKWYELADTVVTDLVGTPGIGGPMKDYSGIALKPDDSTIISFGGGHSGSSDNAVAGLRLSADTPEWEILCTATPSGSREECKNDGDGYDSTQLWWGTSGSEKPNPPHTYDSAQWCAHYNSVLWFGQFGPYNRGGGLPSGDNKILRFKWSTKTWGQPGSADDLGAVQGRGEGTAQDGAGNIYTAGQQSIHKYVPSTGTWSTIANHPDLNHGSNESMVWDSTRDRLFRIGAYSGGPAPAIIACSNGAITIPTLTGSGGDLAELATSAGESPSVCYDPHNDRFMVMNGTSGTFFAINASTFAVTKVTPTTVSGSVPNCQSYGAGFRTAFGRLKYVPQLKGVVYCPSDLTNAWFMRLA